MLAAAWAAVAAIILKYTTQPAEAAVANVIYSTTGPGSLPNTVDSTVLIEAGSGLSNTGPVLQTQCNTANPSTVLFQSVIGTIPSPGTAIAGFCSAGTGVWGQTYSGHGVRGEVFPFSNANAIAVYGLNNSPYTGPGPGAGGFGVYGLSAKGHGLVGATATAGAGAVVGATNGVAGAYAGVFYGPVIVGGNFTVVGGAKSAAVLHPDGSHRRLYCLESPESWFEDFGTGQLEGGCAAVHIDPDFAALVDVSSYHVFLTQYEEHNILAVKDRTPNGFQVHARNPDANGEFSWRVVAKRKDIVGPRLESVSIPPEPTLPSLPDVPPVEPAVIRGRKYPK